MRMGNVSSPIAAILRPSGDACFFAVVSALAIEKPSNVSRIVSPCRESASSSKSGSSR